MLGDKMITEGGRTHRSSRPLPLRVDPVEHADEIARFQRRIVMGPLDTDCHVWSGGLSDDGYGVFRITRDGVHHVVRTSRYALALSLKGIVLGPDVFALHGCLCIAGLTMRVSRLVPMRRRARISGCLSRDGGCGSRRII